MMNSIEDAIGLSTEQLKNLDKLAALVHDVEDDVPVQLRDIVDKALSMAKKRHSSLMSMKDIPKREWGQFMDDICISGDFMDLCDQAEDILFDLLNGKRRPAKPKKVEPDTEEDTADEEEKPGGIIEKKIMVTFDGDELTVKTEGLSEEDHGRIERHFADLFGYFLEQDEQAALKLDDKLYHNLVVNYAYTDKEGYHHNEQTAVDRDFALEFWNAPVSEKLRKHIKLREKIAADNNLDVEVIDSIVIDPQFINCEGVYGMIAAFNSKEE